ncbi:translation elongation factor Ts [Pseudanabaena sp. PCC 6802]|uniref:translation elongation factor Ts n=1 Tax=Pseudanabaena sp. PCC 6802 TaxID=118173 RepID=UPI0003465F10|nr:translation elongation factor Ts [Pseudanabaena sp. PCC 6802]
MAEITTQQVQELRARTGAGIKDCKKALQETNGDATKAAEYLRQKGLASAVKKASRVATEGIVHSYIHFGARIGVLVEVNCETDFVARREELKELADNVAKQIAACPNVEYVSTADIPAAIADKEREIEAGKDDLANKPEAIRDKIVQGRIEKRLKEMALLDQPYIKDQSITVDELVKTTAAKLSENIKVRRFVRFVVGEGTEEEVPSTSVPQQEAPQPEAPQPEAPQPEAPAEGPKAEAPAETPPAEAPPAAPPAAKPNASKSAPKGGKKKKK